MYLIIIALGVCLGIVGGSSNILFLSAAFALIAGVFILLSNYSVATIIVAFYIVIDYGLRTFVPSLAGVWDELLMVCLFMLWFLKLIIHRKEPSYKFTPMDVPIIIYFSANILVLLVNSPDFKIAIEGIRANVEYLIWYFLVIMLLKKERDIQFFCNALIIVAAGIAIHGIYQYITGAEMPANWVDSAEAGIKTRVYSIIGSPNILGSLMTLVTPMTLSFALAEKRILKKLIYVVLAGLMILCLFLTYSRGAWIGFAVAMAVFVWIRDKRLFVPAIILMVAVVIFVPSISDRITYMLSPDYTASSLRAGRLVRWLTGLEMFKETPIFGVGLGQFGGAVAMNNGIKGTFYMDNYFLKTAVETGLVGLCAFVILMVQAVVWSYRTFIMCKDKYYKIILSGIFAGILGTVFHNFVENIFEVPMMTSYFWVLVAIVMHLWFYYDANAKDN